MVPGPQAFAEVFSRRPVEGHGRRPVQIVAEREPDAFRRAFRTATTSAAAVFLADPNASALDRQQLQALAVVPAEGEPGMGWLGIPTGGTSGVVKLARHDEASVSAAVGGFVEHFGVTTVNAIGLLPLHHVSGFMAWMRCELTGGEYHPWGWKQIERGDRPLVRGADWFLSLVPTQLDRLLGQPVAVDWLRRFRAVFVGGGPSWAELVERGAEARLPLAFSYGMTETAAMVTALRPEDFRAGQRGSGRALPHARVRLGEDGAIRVDGPSLFRGYWPDWRGAGEWTTPDRGAWDADGNLRVLGRRDAVIISGGEKIDPAEVEAVLRASGLFDDVGVVGVPDPEWGEIVVAFHPALAAGIDRARLEPALRNLARYKWPKRYIAIDPWPRTPQGKLPRSLLLAAIGQT